MRKRDRTGKRFPVHSTKQIKKARDIRDFLEEYYPIAVSRNQTVSVNRIRNIMVKRKRVVSSQESEFSRFFV